MDLKKLRQKALKSIENGRIIMRTCWVCNKAHTHLKEETKESVLYCISCGSVYYKNYNLNTGKKIRSGI